MRLPWKQTAPIKQRAINLAAGLNSLCLHLSLANGARRFLESGYFATATLTFGPRGGYNGTIGLRRGVVCPRQGRPRHWLVLGPSLFCVTARQISTPAFWADGQ